LRPHSSEAGVSRFSRVRIFGIVSNDRGFMKDILLTNLDVHVDDLSDAFILLAEEALKPNGGSAQWGDEGYYFAEAGEYVRFPPFINCKTRGN
jgi:hypothetical protein